MESIRLHMRSTDPAQADAELFVDGHVLSEHFAVTGIGESFQDWSRCSLTHTPTGLQVCAASFVGKAQALELARALERVRNWSFLDMTGFFGDSAGNRLAVDLFRAYKTR